MVSHPGRTVQMCIRDRLLEVNNSSLKPGSPRPGAKENYYVMLDLCRKYNVSVIVSSDSHCASDAGCHSYALELLKETGFPEELVEMCIRDSPSAVLSACEASLALFCPEQPVANIISAAAPQSPTFKNFLIQKSSSFLIY